MKEQKSIKDSCIYMLKDVDQNVLYVGITNNHGRRIEQHYNYKYWANEVNNITVSEYMNRNQAHIYEIYYISKLQPKYNDDFNNLNCDNFYLKLDELIFNKYSYEEKEFTSFNISITNDVIKELTPSACKLLMFFQNNKCPDEFIRVKDFYPSQSDLQLYTNLSAPTYQKSMNEIKDKNFIKIKRKSKYNMIQLMI